VRQYSWCSGAYRQGQQVVSQSTETYLGYSTYTTPYAPRCSGWSECPQVPCPCPSLLYLLVWDKNRCPGLFRKMNCENGEFKTQRPLEIVEGWSSHCDSARPDSSLRLFHDTQAPSCAQPSGRASGASRSREGLGSLCINFLPC